MEGRLRSRRVGAQQLGVSGTVALRQTSGVPAHALILGCGRSGTSILGELFESLPGVTYASEPRLDDLPAIAANKTLVVKVPQVVANDTPPGLPAAPDDLYRALPTPLVVIWQVRHPLDAICSLRVGISQNWGHHPRPPDWLDWQRRPLLEQCAHHWAVINGAGYELVRTVAVLNRFEDMIGDPRTTADTMVRSIGIDPESVTAELAAWSQRVQDTNNEHFVEAITSRRHSRPDHARRVGRWRENLSSEEVAAVLPIVAPAASLFGYDLPSPRA